MKSVSLQWSVRECLSRIINIKEIPGTSIPPYSSLHVPVPCRLLQPLTGKNHRPFLNGTSLGRNLDIPPHKVHTYVEYRAVSGVFQNIDSPPPLHPATVSSPRTIHSPGGEVRGWGTSIFWKTPDIGLASYNNLSTFHYIYYFTIRQ